jgi:hypothetical protein
MNPEQPAQDPSGNNYDFIVTPGAAAPKRKFSLPFGGDSFITKVLFLLGGAVVLMVAGAVVVNLLFGGRNNTGALLLLTQNQQEIVRVGQLGKNASGQDVKNAAINTALSVKSQQRAWLEFLGKRGTNPKPEELNLKKDSATDSRLEAAEQTSTFDSTYTSVMRTLLEDYLNELKTVYDGTSSKQQRPLLSTHYNEVQLLLKQWPSSTLGLANY